MGLAKLVCTGCSCLCDDIEVDSQGSHITRIENACVKGASLLYAGDNLERRAPFAVEGRKVPIEQAIEKAAHLLQEAGKVLIFGLDNCTLEAQAVGIGLAQALGAVIDDVSSFSHGVLVQAILDGHIPTCSFAEVENADLLIYWGSNPYHSHPRHLSKFSYYSHKKWDEAGWIPQVVISCVEVRDTETSSLCRPVFEVEPGGDRDFIGKILAAIRDKDETQESKAFVELVRNSAFCVIFVGLGLIYALDNDFHFFKEMLHELSRWTRFAVIPMLGHFNTLGFNRLLFEKTGHVNKVSFANGVSYGDEFSFLEQMRNRVPDCVLIAGSDPFSSQPRSLMRNLEGVPIICLDPFVTPTTMAAEVVFGTAVSGLETAGKAIRMDGIVVSLLQGREPEIPTDEEILRQLLNRIG